MAVGSGVVDQLEAQGLGAVMEEQGLCALELAIGGGTHTRVLGMVPESRLESRAWQTGSVRSLQVRRAGTVTNCFN